VCSRIGAEAEQAPGAARNESSNFLTQELEEAMSTKQQDKQPAGQGKQERQHLTALIGKHVMSALGQPGALHRVQVHPLWDDHYRVNIFLGGDAASAKVAHSYFLVADGDGNIVAATPKITRQY